MAHPAFIIGPPRSGTTLLLRLLGRHPAIAAHGEDFHPYHHDLTRFVDRTDPEDHFRLTAAEASGALVAEYRRAIETALDRAGGGATQFLLKISTLSIQVDYVRALVPQARFIQLVRDGRDAACSMEELRRALGTSGDGERMLGPAPDPLGLWCAQNLGPGPLAAAASWAYHVARSTLDLAFAGPGAWIRIRYEDLLADPEPVIASVLAFLQLDLTDSVREQISQVGATGPESLGFSTTEAKGARVGRFERELSGAVRVAASPILEAPMRLLGYEPDPWPEVETFFAACEELGIDPERWRDRAKAEVAWFERQRRAFAPERQLRVQPVVDGSRPLLIDGALVGTQRAMVDGDATSAVSWVQKQDRQTRFVDPGGVFPAVACAMDGQTTVAELERRFGLDASEARPVLDRLVGLGFVGLL